jgi:chromosome segregation ATPase
MYFMLPAGNERNGMRIRLLRSRCAGLWLILLLATLVGTLTAMSHSQSSDSPSLGDLARKQRQKQSKTANTKKVITNEEIPEHPEESSGSLDGTSSSATDGPRDASAAAADAGSVMKTGEQWKEAIQQQKSALSDLKNHIDELQDSIHFVEANRYRNGVEYNKVQAEKQKEVQRLQSQLAQLQKNLESMQESARKAGFGSSVWDP